MSSTGLLWFLFFWAVIATLPGSVSSKKVLDFDTLDGPSTSWPDLYTRYVSERRPVKLLNAYLDNPASRQWSSDYIHQHPGAALTFRNLTKKNTASIRTIVENSDYFMRLLFRVPFFLRADLVVPKCLDCDQLIDRMNSPLWLWHFQKTQVKLHNEQQHELWCIVKGTIGLTLLPKWTDGMIDHFLTDNALSEAPTYKDTEHYQVTLEKGDCFYVPADFLRQWQPAQDTMAVIFQIENSVLIEREKLFQRCRSVGSDVSLEEIKFADDDKQEDGAIANTLVLQKIISYLGSDKCLDLTQLREALRNEQSIHALEGSTLDETVKDLFAVLDTDQDEEFCWPDVDVLTFNSASELTKLVNSRLALTAEMEKSDRKRDTDEL